MNGVTKKLGFSELSCAVMMGLLTTAGMAQDVIAPLAPEDMIAPQDKQYLDQQAESLFHQWDRLAQPYKDSVVYITTGRQLVVQGTVVAPRLVITKLSDLQHVRSRLSVVDAAGHLYGFQVLMSIPEHDLVLLGVPGLQAPPVSWPQTSVTLQEGDLIGAVAPGGRVTEFGVVSVAQRSLRSEDIPYLGLVADPQWDGKGARIAEVARRSGAHKAGVRVGDIITRLNGVELEGMFSMRSVLNGVKPGDTVTVELMRGGQKITGNIKTSSRPNFESFPQKRLEQMNSMGNRMSQRRDNFPLIVQSDMTLPPEHAGSPVINTDGQLAGIALSRAGRTETYLLPAWACQELVKAIEERMNPNETDDIPTAEEPIDEVQPKKQEMHGGILRKLMRLMQRHDVSDTDY
jgi:hypothetical protein